MKPIKRRTYYNFVRVVKLIMAKGYDRETSGKLARRLFDDYEASPLGLTVLQRVDLILTKEEFEAQQAEYSDRVK